MNFSEYFVTTIDREQYAEYILDIHYAGRYPSISFAYGLFKGVELVGVITYGTPASATLRKGIAGEKFKDNVLELNRLCLRNNTKNEASFLIGKSLKLLPPERIIISFADTNQDHLGTVYQATNFIYLGLSAKRTNWTIKGQEHLHGQTIADKFRGFKDRSRLIRLLYGDDFYLKPRPRKHRYLIFTGGKLFKKKVLRELKYKIEQYPK